MKGICTPILTAVLLTIGKRWKRPKSPSKGGRESKMWPMGYQFPYKKIRVNWHLHKMDEPWSHTKWTKPVITGHHHIMSHIWVRFPEQSNSHTGRHLAEWRWDAGRHCSTSRLAGRLHHSADVPDAKHAVKTVTIARAIMHVLTQQRSLKQHLKTTAAKEPNLGALDDTQGRVCRKSSAKWGENVIITFSLTLSRRKRHFLKD